MGEAPAPTAYVPIATPVTGTSFQETIQRLRQIVAEQISAQSLSYDTLEVADSDPTDE